MRYSSSHDPIDDHGGQPLVLMVFDDPLVETRFLGVVRSEIAGTKVKLLLWVSSRDVLEKHGPLGPAWRNADTMEPARAFE